MLWALCGDRWRSFVWGEPTGELIPLMMTEVAIKPAVSWMEFRLISITASVGNMF